MAFRGPMAFRGLMAFRGINGLQGTYGLQGTNGLQGTKTISGLVLESRSLLGFDFEPFFEKPHRLPQPTQAVSRSHGPPPARLAACSSRCLLVAPYLTPSCLLLFRNGAKKTHYLTDACAHAAGRGPSPARRALPHPELCVALSQWRSRRRACGALPGVCRERRRAPGAGAPPHRHPGRPRVQRADGALGGGAWAVGEAMH
eukprot:153561-Chlamydomonas_euryale.AAC.2